MTDKMVMLRAISLAKKGMGYVSPNPLVGAVIIKDSEVVSEAWHERYGGHHAEVNAINMASDSDLEGSTLYVNLEPCVHFGKTPPCVPLIIQKKIARVVIGMIDPNPEVSGKGVVQLREAGIQVDVGVLEEESRWLNRFFINNVKEKKAYTILKVAQSIDGCIATSSGESKWLTGDESLRRSHLLRNSVDAILIGKKTALMDNPELTVRHVDGKDPKRILLDTNLSLPLTINAFKDPSRTNVFICCKYDASRTRKAENLRVAGIKVIPVETDSTGKIRIDYLLKELYYSHGIVSVLVEGGAEVFSAFMQSGLVDELHVFTAPIIIGNGIHSFRNLQTQYLRDAKHMKTYSMNVSGEDIHTISIKK